MNPFSPENFFDLSTYEHKPLFTGIEFAWDALSKIKPYLASQALGKIDVEVPNGVYLINPESISIGKGTVIEPGAYIKGPCIIGENCLIRHGAYIRGDLITGSHCVIGHTTEIKHAILLEGVRADHFAYIGDSILGNRVHLGAGVKLANFKLDGCSIAISLEGHLINTGRNKLGALLGDDVQIGCNTVTCPGTLLGKGVLCYPGLTIRGFIEAKSLIKPSSNPLIIKRQKR
jgi:NDP-sugar pyrophosphorylase family protein